MEMFLTNSRVRRTGGGGILQNYRTIILCAFYSMIRLQYFYRHWIKGSTFYQIKLETWRNKEINRNKVVHRPNFVQRYQRMPTRKCQRMFCAPVPISTLSEKFPDLHKKIDLRMLRWPHSTSNTTQVWHNSTIPTVSFEVWGYYKCTLQINLTY